MPKPDPNLPPEANASRGNPIRDTPTSEDVRAKALDYALRYVAMLPQLSSMLASELETELWANVDRFEAYIEAGR